MIFFISSDTRIDENPKDERKEIPTVNNILSFQFKIYYTYLYLNIFFKGYENAINKNCLDIKDLTSN